MQQKVQQSWKVLLVAKVIQLQSVKILNDCKVSSKLVKILLVIQF